MAIGYTGIAGYIATTSLGDTVVDLEFDIPAGSLLAIAGVGGHGSVSENYIHSTWASFGNYYYLTNVVDTQSNGWGYAMDPLGDNTCGSMPICLVTTPLDAGTDTVTVTLAEEGVHATDPAYVARILCFTGFAAFTPSNGLPVAMQVPFFNTPYNGTSFYTPDPDDLIPLPALVNPGLSVFGISRAGQQAGNLDLFYGGFVVGTNNNLSYGATSQSLFVAAISWDGTITPYDYYFTDKNNSSDPIPSASPSPLGLSSDNGTIDLTDPVPWDGTWHDIGFDTLTSVFETRYAYMVQPAPTPDLEIGPFLFANYDVGSGSWGDSYDQGQDTAAFPFEAGSYSPPPTLPLGDPNIITSPVSFSLQFMEGIASGVEAGQRFDVKIT